MLATQQKRLKKKKDTYINWIYFGLKILSVIGLIFLHANGFSAYLFYYGKVTNATIIAKEKAFKSGFRFIYSFKVNGATYSSITGKKYLLHEEIKVYYLDYYPKIFNRTEDEVFNPWIP